MIFVYLFIGLIIVLLIVAALLPRIYNIEKTVIVKKPVSEVMKRVGDLNEYAVWNPWQQSDPSSSKTITGSPSAEGHKYAWQGKKVGMGSLSIRSIDDKHIHFDLEFLKPWKSNEKITGFLSPGVMVKQKLPGKIVVIFPGLLQG